MWTAISVHIHSSPSQKSCREETVWEIRRGWDGNILTKLYKEVDIRALPAVLVGILMPNSLIIPNPKIYHARTILEFTLKNVIARSEKRRRDYSPTETGEKPSVHCHCPGMHQIRI
jgi:hypothetical protein